MNLTDRAGNTCQVGIQIQERLPNGQSRDWLMRLSQGYNEIIYYGCGLSPTTQLADRIRAIMAQSTATGTVVADPKDRVLAEMMSVCYYIEYLVTAIVGERTIVSDAQAFVAGLQTLCARLSRIDEAEVGPWVQERLAAAQGRSQPGWHESMEIRETATNGQTRDWLMRLSQGFNEVVFYGTGFNPEAEMGRRIEGMMAQRNGGPVLADPIDRALAQVMDVCFQIEMFTGVLAGDRAVIPDAAAFMKRWRDNLAHLHDLATTGPVASQVAERLRLAVGRWRQHLPVSPPAAFRPVVVPVGQQMPPAPPIVGGGT